MNSSTIQLDADAAWIVREMNRRSTATGALMNRYRSSVKNSVLSEVTTLEKVSTAKKIMNKKPSSLCTNSAPKGSSAASRPSRKMPAISRPIQNRSVSEPKK